jgi:2-keto-3-deoxy-L-rhamnonate aldolase RhmA
MVQYLDLDRKLPLGTFLFSGSPNVAEAACLAGLDFVIVDREHSPSSWDSTVSLIRAAAAADCPALVRVTGIDRVEIGHAVDAGAAGVIVPLVSSREDVKAVVQAARYSPIGQKGACPVSRNAGLGLKRSGYADVVTESNRRFLLIGLIESRAGIDNLHAILTEEPGLDLVLLGRSDLAADLGQVGNIGHPAVQAAVGHYVRATRASKKGGMVVIAGEDIGKWADMGMRLVVQGTDIEAVARFYVDAVAAHRAVLDVPPAQ